MGWVTMYMCSQACSGIVTPLMRPSSRAHMPAQLTRISVAMDPAEVSTPVTAPFATLTPVTLTPSISRAPPARAPRASACVMSAGLALPSPGIHTAPTRSSVRISG